MNSSNLNIDFTVKMGDGLNSSLAYDANGNILQVQQMGLKLNSSSLIDNLAYTYNANSNKLASVTDGTGAANTKLGDFTDGNISGDDYGYDLNGNMITDKNKSIGGSTGIDQATGGAILYNHLNLPAQITIAGKGTITYIYDAAGNKLEKKTVDNTASPTKTTVTDYIAGHVYENNALQFFGHPQGRVRPVTANGYQTVPFAYDYFVKDHLGNTRAVLTDEWKQDVYPAAAVEGGAATTTEQLYYSINTSDIVPNPALPYTYPNENNYGIPPNPNPDINASATSQQMYRLNGKYGDRTGLGITLRVMAGDNVSILGSSYWQGNAAPDNSFPVVVNSLITALAGTGAVAASGEYAANLTGNGFTPNGVTNLLSTEPNTGSSPKAYVNWILFDDHFVPVGSGFDMVGAAGTIKNHQFAASITKNGYLYVYCSDESDQDVFFDNLQVMHNRGPLLEETQYYSYGLAMAEISSKAAGSLENKYKYNGKELQHSEFSDGSGLEEYDYGARFYDGQIGRWWIADPLAAKYQELTPYNYVANNPIKYTDPDGKIIRDQKGNIVITTTGQQQVSTPITYGINPRLNADGTSTQTYFQSTYNVVKIFADNGVPVEALQLVSAHQIETTVDNNGNIVNVKTVAIDNQQYGFESDCHGYTFTDGKLWINDDQVGNLLINDNYSLNVKEELAGVVVFSKNGKTVHSAKRNGNGKYDNDAGILVTEYGKTLKESARGLTDTDNKDNVLFANKKSSDRVMDTNLGTVNSAGVRTITDPNEIAQFMSLLKSN